MPCCHHHCPHACYPYARYEWDWSEPYPPYPRRYRSPSRDPYTQSLEEDRERLEARLRRLEQELEELRRTSRTTQEQT